MGKLACVGLGRRLLVLSTVSLEILATIKFGQMCPTDLLVTLLILVQLITAQPALTPLNTARAISAQTQYTMRPNSVPPNHLTLTI